MSSLFYSFLFSILFSSTASLPAAHQFNAAAHPFSSVPLPLNSIPPQIRTIQLCAVAILCRFISSQFRCMSAHFRSWPSRFSAMLCLSCSGHVYAAAVLPTSSQRFALTVLFSSLTCRLLAFPYIALSLQPRYSSAYPGYSLLILFYTFHCLF